jgi:hypothetical protein
MIETLLNQGTGQPATMIMHDDHESFMPGRLRTVADM